MSCYACSKKYGLFCKEVGCPNCGFSFCTKCLKKSIEIPKVKDGPQKVCLSCYDKITKAADKAELSDKMDESLSYSPMDAPLPEEANIQDEIIEKRLAMLKQSNLNIEATDKGIAIRVANLKGIPYSENSNVDLLTMVDKRTDQEKTNDLVKQFLEERSIDNTVSDPIKDIEKRLAALKSDSVAVNTNIPAESDQEDDESIAKKLANKYLEEATLPDIDLTEEEENIVGEYAAQKERSALKELPWCIICNEDAVVRCVGCDGELFCRTCFKDIHDDEEYRAHVAKPYVKDDKSQYMDH